MSASALATPGPLTLADTLLYLLDPNPPTTKTMVDKARMYPATPQETEDIETLNAMMGGTLDAYHALSLLRKHNNNLEKAASALLEGDTGVDDQYVDLPSLEPLDVPGPGPRTPPREYALRSSLFVVSAECGQAVTCCDSLEAGEAEPCDRPHRGRRRPGARARDGRVARGPERDDVRAEHARPGPELGDGAL